MVQRRDDVVGLDAAILSPPAVWEASGHLRNFTDPLVDCRNCHQRWRDRQDRGRLPELRVHRVHRGPGVQPHVQNPCRPRRGRGRGRLPSSGDGSGDVRRTSQMSSRPPARGRPSASPRWASHSATRSPRRTSSSVPASSSRWKWSTSSLQPTPTVGSSTGARSGSVGTSLSASPRTSCAFVTTTRTSSPTTRRPRPTSSSGFPGGGTSSRGSPTAPTYDLKVHAEASGERLEYFDQATGERYVPYVIEPAAGATRTMMAFLLAAYDEDEIAGEARTVLRVSPAPRSLPGGRAAALQERNPRSRLSRQVLGSLQPHFMCDYDLTQSIGRRYRRQDEIGTP